MAKKKANPELQDETMQDGLDMASEGTDLPFSETMDGSGDDFPAFPPPDAPPFEDTAEGGSVPQDNTPFNADGAFLDGGEAVENIEPAGGDSEDYSAFLQAAREGGVEPVLPSENEPLLLDATDDGGDGDPSDGAVSGYDEAPPQEPAPARVESRRTAPRQERDRILTIDPRAEVQTREDLEGLIWHESRNAYRTRRILTGTLGGLERTPSGKTLAVVDYKGFRVAILLQEMLFLPKRMPTNADYPAFMERQRRNLNNMLGAEIDFIVRGIDSNTRSIVASRKDAMLKKRQTFYMNTDELGGHMIYEGRVVQARVIAVAEKVIRVEVFGVECPIIARDLSWEWLGDAREHFCVGDRVLVRVLTIDRSSAEDLSITASIRSVSSTTNVDNVKKCQRQCRYVGRVTDVRSGVVYIRLNNGVNAIAHTCYDMRMPGRKDTVSFAVTRLDEKRGVAIGIITRIIKQNL